MTALEKKKAPVVKEEISFLESDEGVGSSAVAAALSESPNDNVTQKGDLLDLLDQTIEKEGKHYPG